MTGLGLEVLVWIRFMQPWCKDKHCEGNAEREFWWRAAQFFFPILVVTAVGLATAHNFLALPFLIVGLWKFGYPETINHLYLALFDDQGNRLTIVSDYLNGLGTLLHHSGAALAVCSITTTFQFTRPMMSITMLLVVQHWFALLAYSNVMLYAFCTLVVEFLFEWVVFSVLSQAYSQHWVIALTACVLVFAHWLYFIAGALHLLGSGTVEESGHNVHVRAIAAFRGHNKPSADPSTDLESQGTPHTKDESGCGETTEDEEHSDEHLDEDDPHRESQGTPRTKDESGCGEMEDEEHSDEQSDEDDPHTKSQDTPRTKVESGCGETEDEEHSDEHSDGDVPHTFIVV